MIKRILKICYFSRNSDCPTYLIDDWTGWVFYSKIIINTIVDLIFFICYFLLTLKEYLQTYEQAGIADRTFYDVST